MASGTINKTMNVKTDNLSISTNSSGLYALSSNPKIINVYGTVSGHDHVIVLYDFYSAGQACFKVLDGRTMNPIQGTVDLHYTYLE